MMCCNVGEMDQLFVDEINSIGECSDPCREAGGIAIQDTGRAEGGEHEDAVGQRYQRIAGDGTDEAVLPIFEHEPPCEANEQEAE